MYNSLSLPRECIIHPAGPEEEKDGRKERFQTKTHYPPRLTVVYIYIYILLTLNLRYDEIRNRFNAIRLNLVYESRIRFLFSSFSFFRGESFRIKRNYPFWSGGQRSVPRIISRRRIPSFSIYLKGFLSSSRMIQPAANYKTRRARFP